jgi:choline monooxygenase
VILFAGLVMININEHTKLLNEKNAITLHADFYTNPDIYSLEQESIFQNHWQYVAHSQQLNNIGDYIVSNIGKVPIIILKNEQEQLTGFHNVCRHRAGPLATENGNSKVLRCKYHGWTYQLDGQLKSAPEMQSTTNFEVCQHKLPSVYVTEWQGLVFAAINQPTADIESLFAGIRETIKPIDLNNLTFSHRDEYLVECNWKVYMDNYLEGYHLPHVHPGLNKLLDYRQYKTELSQWYSYQYSPLESAEDNQAEIYYGEGSAHYYCVFPNLMLNILPGRLQTNLIVPVGQSKTKIIFDYFYANTDSDQTKSLIEQDQSFSDEVQQEDITICEQVQLGLLSGSYQSGPLCIKRESGVLHFQNLVRASLKHKS